MNDFTFDIEAEIVSDKKPLTTKELVDENGDDVFPAEELDCESSENDESEEPEETDQSVLIATETTSAPSEQKPIIKTEMSSSQLVTCMQQQVGVCEGIVALIEKYETHKLKIEDTTLPDFPEEIKRGLIEHTTMYNSWCKAAEKIAAYFAKIETPISTKKSITTTAKTTPAKTPERPKEEQFSFDFN